MRSWLIYLEDFLCKFCLYSAPTADSNCGNGRIDSPEECDGGLMGSLGLDDCCDSNCRLKGAATCRLVIMFWLKQKVTFLLNIKSDLNWRTS